MTPHCMPFAICALSGPKYLVLWHFIVGYSFQSYIFIVKVIVVSSSKNYAQYPQYLLVLDKAPFIGKVVNISLMHILLS